MPADTVHRQEEKEETSANTPLTAMFEATVALPIREAADSVNRRRPDFKRAEPLLVGARNAIKALASSYRDSDPVLADSLEAADVLLMSMTNTLANINGRGKAEDAIPGNFRVILNQVLTIAPKLH